MSKFLSAMTASAVIPSLFCGAAVQPSKAASHREAPLIAMDASADNTDVYAFRSTESGRDGFVTLIANFSSTIFC